MAKYATAALVLGLLSIVLGFITGIPAIYFGIIALKNKTHDREYAIVGIAIGAVMTIITLFVTLPLTIIFLGRMNEFQDTATNCVGQGGHCIPGACPANTIDYPALRCPESARCCILPP